MRRILDLIRVDIITMNGGKNNTRSMLIMLLVIFGVLGFVFSSLVGIYCPLLVGGFFAPMIFSSERKFHSEKLWGLLPIRRRDLVNARFLLSVVVYTALFVVFYLLMLLSQTLKLNNIIFENGSAELDLVAILARRTDGAMTELGLFNLAYFTAFAFGLIFMTGSLRNHFKDSKAADGTLKKATRKEYIYLLLVAAVGVIWALIISGVIKIGSLLMVLAQLFLQLATAANGFLLAAAMVAIGVFSAIYKYVCTVLEYDEKEL